MTTQRLVFEFAAVALIASGLSRPIQDAPGTRDAQEAAFRTGGFPAAAAITGSYLRVDGLSGNDGGPSDLAQLVRSAPLIVVGETRSSRSVLAPYGKVIRTHFTLHVTEVLKGALTPSESRDGNVVVSVLGGRVSFPNGNWAELDLRGAAMPVDNARYVFFLKRIDESAFQGPEAVDVPPAQFWPSFAQQGTFQLDSQGLVRPAARSIHAKLNSPSKDFKDKPAEMFLREIRQAVKKESSSGQGHKQVSDVVVRLRPIHRS